MDQLLNICMHCIEIHSVSFICQEGYICETVYLFVPLSFCPLITKPKNLFNDLGMITKKFSGIGEVYSFRVFFIYLI